VLQMREFAADGAMRRYPVDIVEDLRLEGLREKLELVAVVFYAFEKGSYGAVCRGPDNCYWSFEGKEVPRRRGFGWIHMRSHEACLLFYSRVVETRANVRLAQFFAGEKDVTGSAVVESSRDEAAVVQAAISKVAEVASKRAKSSMGVVSSGDAGSADATMRDEYEETAAKRAHSGINVGAASAASVGEPLLRLASESERAEKRPILEDDGPASREDDGPASEMVLGEERALAAVFERYPKLRDVRGLGGLIDSWRADPEKARVYAENAERNSWPDVEARGGKRKAGVALASTIWQALSRKSGVAGHDVDKFEEKEIQARRERAAHAAEQRAAAARQLSMKELFAGRSTQAGRLAVAVLKAKAAEAARVAAAGKRASGSVGSRSGSAASSEKLNALAQEFGKERLDRVLLQFRRQAAHESRSADALPDLDALASVLAADRAIDLEVDLASSFASQVDEVDRTRWGKMQASLPRQIVDGLLSAFQLEYGKKAGKILSEGWSRDLELWGDLEKNLHRLGVSNVYTEACDSDDVMECIRACLRAHVRLAANCTQAVVADSDMETIARLSTLGYEYGRGCVWTDRQRRDDELLRFSTNQCLADSLLQLLQRQGILSNDISVAERIEACAENRRRLASHADPVLRPRVRDAATGADRGEDPYAYLQHDVHAEPTVLFFLEWFGAKGKVLRELPSGGIRVTVFSRFDSVIGGRPVVQICERDASQAPHDMLRMNLYNLTGDGASGYHYDPLFATDRVVIDDEEVVERRGGEGASKSEQVRE